MKQSLTAIALCLTVWLSTPVAFAGPHGGGGFGGGNGGDHFFDRNNDGYNDAYSLQDLQERRRAREERGFQRLKQLKWQTGYTMPQHYRSDRYKVDYGHYNLPKPARGQQWYKVNNDYLLINDDNTIIQVR
ncbi:RcnB family protein [Acinetobacter sp. MB5]|uniref:RcnB family protein n=1 Tax=Acinetobacter sp. MB5 TaxID=2069438 RepID=UPI000DD0B43A|nr:RcnB family protein [Acinetobacter sp. MB5]